MSIKRRYSSIATPSSCDKISSKFSSVSDSSARQCSSKSTDEVVIRSESDLLPSGTGHNHHDENINNLFEDTSINAADVS